jgi:hypothetical protein
VADRLDLGRRQLGRQELCQCRVERWRDSLKLDFQHAVNVDVEVWRSTEFIKDAVLTIVDSYTGTNIVADVSYDAFISSSDSTTVTHDYEVMVWLARLGGAEPLGYSGGAIATVSISGVSWDLYKGSNGWTVYSFVATSEETSFSGDMNDFFTYLVDNQGVPSSYYLQTIGAGTEPFTGSNTWFTVSPYTISLNT